jgi:LmbE family N-acetylglucosaminyl deacetylase
MNWKYFLSVLFCFSFLSSSILFATRRPQPSSSQILHKIQKLNVLGSVLYFAAHPDDENTGFIAYMANERHYETYYLSLTRGDGGQNLIGPEMRELLGMIRTQELLQARNIDGGKQFFTRANDFGYSKKPEETLTVWDKEAVLGDAVWVIRNARPDIIVTRFPPDERAGHGHHTASALLAAEAFEAAADPSRFPDQLKHVQPWKAKRLVWNISPWSVRNREEYVKNIPNYIKLDIGTFNPLLGVSYGEMAARSRSMHKSQGFGAVGVRGTDVEYFEHVKGEKATSDLLDGVNTSWGRVEGATKIPALIDAVGKSFQIANPTASIPGLLSVREAIQHLPESYWRTMKLREVDEAIKDVLGLYLEAVANASTFTPGQPLHISLEAINRSTYPLELVGWSGPFDRKDTLVNRPLKDNQAYRAQIATLIPKEQEISHPYWLTKDIGYAGMYEVEDPLKIGLSENSPPASLAVTLSLGAALLKYDLPVVFKKRDPVRGEVYEPVVIAPAAYSTLDYENYMFQVDEPRPVRVTVTAAESSVKGRVTLKVSEGWVAKPSFVDFNIAEKGGNYVAVFEVAPPHGATVGELTAQIETSDRMYDRGIGVIQYDHIPRQVYFPKSSAKLVRLDLTAKGKRIGYIHGAGDAVPEALEKVGYQVSILEDRDIEPTNLKRFDAVIVGVRAYNTRAGLPSKQKILLDYVHGGGNLIVQYNTSMDLLLKELGPYPFDLSRERVSVEDAGVRILDAESPVLKTPNRITPADFEGWVQERGLYFPQNWDSRYRTVISSNDPGSPPLDGGILYAQHGKGYYVYSSLSWFRNLPAGVPGAYRLFANLIALGK